jgi:hypothetical protein
LNYPSAIPTFKENLLTVKEASIWATRYLKKTVTVSNISYLIQYGRIKKFDVGGAVCVSSEELEEYYKSYNSYRETAYREKLGNHINWALSFDKYKESETTKHIHRLHPYKGKFIPQLVEYFLDGHTDEFKSTAYFKKGDIVLDPFSGSGTTMVQSSELGIHAIGIDVSAFNALIGNCKVTYYDINDIIVEITRITNDLQTFISKSDIGEFEEELLRELYYFNNNYFPVPEYKYKIRNGELDEKCYSIAKERDFLPIYEKLVKKYDIELNQKSNAAFLNKWYLGQICSEIDFVYNEIEKVKNQNTKNILCIILSRTIRSCRATTHSDLATLLEPVTSTYYCRKHGKICKPLFSIYKWWKTYTKDTIARLREFNTFRTETHQLCLVGDSRIIDIFNETEPIHPVFAKLLKTQKIQGIFSSPPYVGLINYHEQHAYAYDLFKFPRNDELEIGPLFKGQGNSAKESYVDGISSVLINCKKFLADDYNIFLVANDKYNLYPKIAEKAGMCLINQFHRPVLNRTEKDKGAYSETIFLLRER